MTYFDSLVVPAKHPNIVSRLRGTHVQTIQYVIKDNNYLSFPESFDLTAYLQTPVQEDGKKEPMAKVVARVISEGATLADLDNLYPHYVMTHLGPLERYIEFRQRRALQESRVLAPTGVFHVTPANGHLTSSNTQLASWLNSMIFNRSIPHRPTQMWVKGPPRCGKSSLINQLEDEFGVSVYRWPTDEQWFDGYVDGAFDLIVLDEYKAQKKITQLNPILSGDRIPLSRRGLPPYVKHDILPVLILSNFSPREAYHKAASASLDALESRIQVVEFLPGESIRLVSDLPELTDIPTPLSEPESPMLSSTLTTPDLPQSLFRNRSLIEHASRVSDPFYDDPNNPSYLRTVCTDAARRVRGPSAKREARDYSSTEEEVPKHRRIPYARGISRFFDVEADHSDNSSDELDPDSDEDPTLGGFICNDSDYE